MVLYTKQKGEWGVENYTTEVGKKLKIHINSLENTINNLVQNELTS